MLWRGFFAYGQFPPTKLLTETWSWANSYQRFSAAIKGSNPDLVVSVHPLCQLMPIWVVQEINKEREREGERGGEKKLRVPFVTIVTDLGGCHNTWFDRRTDALFVPSNQVRNLALQSRINPKKIFQRGLPIRPKFWGPILKKEVLRAKLGLDKKTKTVVIMGGGDGVGGIGKIVEEVSKKCSKLPQPTQLVAVCGNNHKVKAELSAREYPANIKMHVAGFVTNVDEYMGAADCLVRELCLELWLAIPLFCCCIMIPSCSSIVLYNNPSIAYSHHTHNRSSFNPQNTKTGDQGRSRHYRRGHD